MSPVTDKVLPKHRVTREDISMLGSSLRAELATLNNEYYRDKGMSASIHNQSRHILRLEDVEDLTYFVWHRASIGRKALQSATPVELNSSSNLPEMGGTSIKLIQRTLS